MCDAERLGKLGFAERGPSKAYAAVPVDSRAGEILALDHRKRARRTLDDRYSISQSRCLERVDQRPIDGFAASNDQDRDTETSGKLRRIDEPETRERDSAERDGLKRRVEPQPRNPAGEVVGCSIAIHGKVCERDPLDEIGALHHHSDEGNRLNLSLLER